LQVPHLELAMASCENRDKLLAIDRLVAVSPNASATSAPGLGSPLPHLLRDWARPGHICAGTGLAIAGCDTLSSIAFFECNMQRSTMRIAASAAQLQNRPPADTALVACAA
jgi:hypothetical protein